MEIWSAWARKPNKCLWCPHPIHTGDMMFVTKMYWKDTSGSQGENHHRKWTVGHYHIDCFAAQAKDYLEHNPATPSNPNGRPRVPGLTDEQREKRAKLLNKASSLQQQKRKLKVPYPERWAYEANINVKISQVAVELIPLGGVPKGWENCLVLSQRVKPENLCPMEEAIEEARIQSYEL